MRVIHRNVAIGDPRLPARFWSKVQPTTDGCWIWTGCVDNHGYGHFNVADKRVRVHRLAYSALIGPPVEQTLDHLCRVPACVNPSHLEDVPLSVNTLRGFGFAAVCARQIKCKRGHPLSGPNLYLRPGDGARTCRECQRRHQRAHDLRKRQECVLGS